MDDAFFSAFNDKEYVRFGRHISEATTRQTKFSHHTAQYADKPKPVFPPHLGRKPR
jgi:hypothetical protein